MEPLEKFWDSRLGTGILGAFCLWLSYDINANPESWQSGRYLVSTLIDKLGDIVGHGAVSVFPLLLGLLLLGHAVFPRRRRGT